MERKRGLSILAGVAGAAVAAWLTFGFFGIQTLFTDNEVAEAGPTFASGASLVGTEEFEEAMDEAAANPVEVDEEMMPGEIVTLLSGTFTGTDRYDVTPLA